ncbi:MAG: hypothetical protein D6767_06040 [Candidatus Hydrogenedentota bacterium]|nr:MAG: hypothetical protein D6767_06040 [Candidatus Hydrogenedentota bacterium]
MYFKKKYIILTLLFLQWHCASLFKSAFTPPQVSVEDVEIVDAGFNGATLNLKIAVNNPNAIGIKLASFSYEVLTKGEKLASGEKKDPIDIKGKDISRFSVPVTIRYAGLQQGIVAIIKERKLPYEVKTKIAVDTPIGVLHFSPEHKGEIPIPTLPDVEISKVFLDEMGITSTTIVFQVKIKNNSDVKVKLKKFHYEISINDFTIANAEMMLDKTLESEKQTQLVSIPVTLKLLSLKRSLINVIKEGKFRYFVKMNLSMETNYGEFDVPYESEGMSSLY